MKATTGKVLPRNDERIIIHLDLDAFFASVFEVSNPALRSLPLAVQQKQIIVTCNYEARRRGLHKLQLISEAKKVCPDVVIVSGERLDRFRDASKAVYNFVAGFTWNKKVEKLGFDEVFLDVTDIISYNQAMLNSNDLKNSFFQLSCDDPTTGFPFDSSKIAGHGYPEKSARLSASEDQSSLLVRLILGSHLAQHIRSKLVEESGYTTSAGISTSKLLSKLVGSLHKPRSQTTLMPPYQVLSFGDNARSTQDRTFLPDGPAISNVTTFIDSYELGKIPGIGYKMSQKIRSYVTSYPEAKISVGDVRIHPGMGLELLGKLLGGPGSERGIGCRIWGLINGIDDSEVRRIKKIPSQISIEDSYVRLDTEAQVCEQLRKICTSLLKRMQADLREGEFHTNSLYHNRNLGTISPAIPTANNPWIAYPRTIRLTTRPRPPLNSVGTKNRAFKKISRSGALPNFVFNPRQASDIIVGKLVQETLLPMFRFLHPEKGWNLSLMNIAIINIVEVAAEDGTGAGRDIGRMFQCQKQIPKDWKVEDRDNASNELSPRVQAEPIASNDAFYFGQTAIDEDVQWDDKQGEGSKRCPKCGSCIFSFSVRAHELYHEIGD